MNQRWKAVHFKNQLLFAVMKRLAGDDVEISFEGDLSSLPLLRMPGASREESNVLKRNTLQPRQDFVILPMGPDAIRSIQSAIGGTIPRSILHIQVSRAGKLEFGAYDRFHPEALFFGESLGDDFLNDQIARGILDMATDMKPY